MRKFIIAFLFLGTFLSSQVSFEMLLDEMVSVEKLAEFPNPSYRSIQFSSYDRESTEANAEDGFYIEKNGRDWGKGWFANHDFDQCIRMEEIGGIEQAVFAEYEGAGVLTRIWMTGGEVFNYDMPISIYIDGETTPTIKMPFKDLVGGEGLVGKPFSYLASNEKTPTPWRGRNLYFPIPFSKSILISGDQTQLPKENFWAGVYFQIGLRCYEEDTQVEPFTMELLSFHQTKIDEAGKRLLGSFDRTNHEMTQFTNIELKKDESWSATFEKGALSSIDLNFKKGINGIKKERLRNTVIEIQFDGKSHLWMPLDSFFATSYLGKPHQTFFVGNKNREEFLSRWFMPYQKEAKITLHNLGRRKITFDSIKIGEKEYDWSENSMYFNGRWFELRNLETQFKKDINFVQIEGEGVFVGDGLTIFNTYPDWWGEGDEKIYIDGEKFPSHFGTGTEDYYGYAWCRPQEFSAPFNSLASGEGNKAVGTSTACRLRTLDAIPFSHSFSMDMELWHPFYGMMNYAPSAFWYQKPGATNNMKATPETAALKPALFKWDVK